MDRNDDAHSMFTDVDRIADASEAVNYLTRASGMADAQRYKEQSISLLNINEGHQILEAGCGAGDEVRAMAQMVGSSGRVVGIDFSHAMIEEATGRSDASDLPVEFMQGDVQDLDFDDNTFDRCRADRTLQHVENPDKAIEELVRVLRSEGRIVVCEPDWDTLTISSPDTDLTRKVIHSKCDTIRHGWIGRRLRSMFNSAGLERISISSDTFIFTDFHTVNQAFNFVAALDHAQAKYGVEEGHKANWLSQLQEIDESGGFFASVNVFIAVGSK